MQRDVRSPERLVPAVAIADLRGPGRERDAALDVHVSSGLSSEREGPWIVVPRIRACTEAWAAGAWTLRELTLARRTSFKTGRC